MSLTRIFVPQDLTPGSELHLGKEAARYLGRVLRLRVGDAVQVFNGEDGEWSAEIRQLGNSDITLAVHTSIDRASESEFDVHLVQGISRGERMDFVVQKATELGVKRITPVLTDYGVVKLDNKRAQKRRDHWQRVAESACEQSGRICPPLIDAPLSLNNWFGTARDKDIHDRDGSDLVLRPDAGISLTELDTAQTRLCLLVGPEGGFSDREYDDADTAGFEAVTLGPRILRTETAAVAAIAIAQSRWGDI
jgi:16S rRNA (uracil1498-N3)-methyltransferase